MELHGVSGRDPDAGNPIFIFGTGGGLRIEDIIGWDAEDSCSPFEHSSIIANVFVKEETDIQGPYHQVPWIENIDPMTIKIWNHSNHVVFVHSYCVYVGGKTKDSYVTIMPGDSFEAGIDSVFPGATASSSDRVRELSVPPMSWFWVS